MSDTCCGFWNLRIWVQIVLWLSLVAVVYRVTEYGISLETYPENVSVVIFVIIVAFLNVLFNALGIYGERTENPNYLRLFYYALYCGLAVFVFKLIVSLLKMVGEAQLRSDTNKKVEIAKIIVCIVAQICAIMIVRKYYHKLQEAVRQSLTPSPVLV